MIALVPARAGSKRIPGKNIRLLAADDSPDIAWIRHVLDRIRRPRSFAILRPTSPFRTAETIQRAYQEFAMSDGTHDSLRAVQPAREHPGKMWQWTGPGYPITPLLSGTRSDGVPWHSAPTQSLPVFYVQNSSLEMAWTACVEVHGNIHGRKVIPFLTEGYEGMTLDYPEDLERAELLVARGRARLPAAAPDAR